MISCIIDHRYVPAFSLIQFFLDDKGFNFCSMFVDGIEEMLTVMTFSSLGSSLLLLRNSGICVPFSGIKYVLQDSMNFLFKSQGLIPLIMMVTY